MLAPRIDRMAVAPGGGIGARANLQCIYLELEVMKSGLAEPEAERAGESASCVRIERRAGGAEG